MHKTIAFIPVRGGSKSIPMKNIRLLNQRPLLYWTLDAAVGCQLIDHVYVCTDNADIQACAEKYGSNKISVVGRSQEVSGDLASTESVMIEFAEKHSFENIVLIQATSPLLTSEDLEKGIRRFADAGVDAVLSGVRQKRFLWKESDGMVRPVNYEPNNRPRRQDFEGYLVENGAFYITSKNDLIHSNCRISGKMAMVEMSSDTYIELDEEFDWLMVEKILSQRKPYGDEPNLSTKLQKIKAVFSDCDGVLTDGGMYYSEKEDELKKFNTRDGMGFQLLRERGILTGIITGENTELVLRRARKLQINEIHLGVKNKAELLDTLLQKHGLNHEEVAFIGDDINDLEVIRKVGFGCCVSDGMTIVKDASDYITKAAGGQGALRELAELIIEEGGGVV